MTEENLKKKETSNRSFSLTNISILFLALAVIILFVGLYFTYLQLGFYYKNTTLIKQDVKKGIEQSAFNVGDVNQQLHDIKEELSKQQQNMAELRELHQSPDRWRVYQALSLVYLANDQLQFTRDISLIQKLLQTANEEIKNISDPKLQPVLKALGDDLVRLEKIQPIHIEEIYSRLIAVEDKLNQLPLPQNNVQEKQKQATEDLLRTPWWKQGLQQSWQSLQKIVVVQHIDKQAQLWVPLNSEFLNQNLHAKIESAIWGLLHHEWAIYQTSLAQLTSWIKQYFVQDSPVTQSVLNDISELQKVNLQLPVVSVTDSIKALKEYVDSQNESIVKNSAVTH